MKILIPLLVSGIFTSNLITSNLLGIDALEDGKKTNLLSVLKGGLILTLLLFASTAALVPLNIYVVTPLNIEYLSPLICVIVICAMVYTVNLISKRFIPKLYEFFGANIGAQTLCAVALGLCLISVKNELITSYPVALLYSAICGVGFTLVSIIFFTLNERLKLAELPASVRGLPITLFIASLISLAFGGLAGI